MTRIDAHQHFWKLERGDYHWLTEDLGPIYRDFGPGDLSPHLERHGVSGSVLVQAAPTVAETRYLLSLAKTSPSVKGVVGWVDFESPDAPAVIAGLAKDPKLVGLRPMIQDLDDDQWMLRPDLTPAFEALIAQELTFDALTLPRHLPHLKTLLARHGTMRVVIDHGSKPDIRSGAFDGWAADMADLAASTQAYCKLSGLVTEASAEWTVDELAPYVNHLLATFGPDRLIWGSDWPVCLLASSYDRWVEATDQLLGSVDSEGRAAIFGHTAARAYRLKL